jgi:very-short-patch-repair endonuclease
MGPQRDTVDEILASIAVRQHGVVTREQLLDRGVRAKEIRGRVQRGSLLRVHRGVYRVGHRAPSTEATYLAAVLACGEGARLGGKAAAYLWGLMKGSPPIPEVVAIGRRRVEGVHTRRARQLHPADVTTFKAIPVTTVARTLVYLAAEFTEDELARACHEAGVRYRTTPADVGAVLARHPSSPGAAKLRRVMEGGVPVSLSMLEARFRTVLKAENLPPPPETNRRAGGRRVDCRWPQYRLTVELDGYRFHNSRHSWEQDRRREREARARGDEFRRYTYGDVFEDPAFMLAELAALFAAADRQSSSSSSSSGSGPAFSSSST